MAGEGAAGRPVVLVSGPDASAVRRFLASCVKRPLGLKKTQWRARYRETYELGVFSRPLRPQESAEAVYGPYAHFDALVLACLGPDAAGPARAALLAWLKANGFGPVAEMSLQAGMRESERVDLGVEVVRFVSRACPWRGEPLEGEDGGI